MECPAYWPRWLLSRSMAWNIFLVALAMDAGMNEHLSKPVDIKKMFQAMDRLRSQRGQ